jgi:two-component system, OmpR family, phosphate regulon sensor histidine kinase PhoR
MFKNLSPRQIAIYSAVCIALLQLLIFLLFKWFDLLDVPYRLLLILFVIGLAVSYFVGLFFFKRYIFRRIKLIYKIIHRLKQGSKGKSSAPFDVNERIFEDTERDVVKWAASQNKELEELKTLENYRREYLGNVSHELKTPIFNVQGYLHTLLDGAMYDESINHNYLLRASKNVERLQTIVEDLEAISKLEGGDLVLDLAKFNLKELAKEVIEDLELQASIKEIKIFFKEGADQHFIVRADREYIRQVLTNLINNSIKYGKQGGQTKLGFYDMDKYILVEVADNGIGMDQEHLKHVFDRFYRVDKSRSRDAGGSGLGLAIVKHIIEAHNQTINVRSTAGLGSTFGFTLEKAH